MAVVFTYNATTEYNVSEIDACTFTTGSPLPISLSVFEGSFLVLTFIASLAINVLFSVLVVTQRSLHQRDLILNTLLAVLHVAYGFVANMTHLAALITGSWVFGKSACYVEGSALFFIALLRYVLLLAITVDRFGIVMYPFKYPRHSTKVIATVIMIGSLYSLLLPICVYMDGTNLCYNFDPSFHDCFVQINCKTVWCYVYITASISVLILFGVIIPFVLYVIMFHQAKKIRRSQQVTCGSLEQAPAGSGAVKNPSSTSLQPAVTGVLLLVSVVILATPLQLYFMARTILHIDGSLDEVSIIAVLIGNLYYLIPIADGLVIMRHRDVKMSLAAVCRKMCSRASCKN